MSEWQPIETAQPKDYEEVLVLVPRHDDDRLVHRIAMWDPEMDDWIVFMANWHPHPVYWMPLPSPPPTSGDRTESAPRSPVVEPSLWDPEAEKAASEAASDGGIQAPHDKTSSEAPRTGES
jgi:hypothetical protein